MTYKVAKFSFDEGPTWIGYDTGSRWNGWGMPLLSKGWAEQFVQWWNENTPEAPFYYEPETDSYWYMYGVGTTYAGKVYAEPQNIELPNGKRVHVYNFGCDLCWNVEKPVVEVDFPTDDSLTVGELIELLEQLDPSKLIKIGTDEHGVSDIFGVYQGDAGVTINMKEV